MSTAKHMGGCRLERVQSRSEHSDLYRAWSEELQRPVMIKVLSPRYPSGSRTAKRFLRGGKIAISLEQRNIVRTFSAGEDRGRPHMLMEFIPGHSLDRILEVKEKLPWEVATGIVRQVAKALEAAYTKNVVHRGIEPSHIMLSPGGRATVLGFGLARLAEASDAAITAEGALVNVGAYSPPETGEGVQDIRGDLYSLGCVYYHLLAGKPPFDGRDPLDILHQHRTVDPWPVNDIASVPDAIAGVVHTLLAKSLADRVRTPSELIHLLDAAVNPEVLGAQGLKPDRTLVMTTRNMLALREQYTVLVCDDQDATLRELKETFRLLGVTVLTTRDGRAAVQTLKDRKVDLLLTDLKVPGVWGRSYMDAVRGASSACEIVLLRRGRLAETLFGDKRFRIAACLERPLDLFAVRRTVQEQLKLSE